MAGYDPELGFAEMRRFVGSKHLFDADNVAQVVNRAPPEHRRDLALRAARTARTEIGPGAHRAVLKAVVRLGR